MSKNKKLALEYDYFRAHQLQAAGRLLRDPLLTAGADCPPTSDLLELALGQLDGETRHVLEPHVNTCPHCIRCLKSYRRAGGLPEDDPTVLGGTFQARSKATWPVLRARLRPWLPALLSLAGLNPTQVTEFLDFVEERFIPISKDQRLRYLLPGWLKEFGGAAARLDELSDAHLAWLAVRVVAGRAVAGESPATRQAREVLLANQDLATHEDVQRLTAAGGLPQLSKLYWRTFFNEVGVEAGELKKLLQTSQSG